MLGSCARPCNASAGTCRMRNMYMRRRKGIQGRSCLVGSLVESGGSTSKWCPSAMALATSIQSDRNPGVSGTPERWPLGFMASPKAVCYVFEVFNSRGACLSGPLRRPTRCADSYWRQHARKEHMYMCFHTHSHDGSNPFGISERDAARHADRAARPYHRWMNVLLSWWAYSFFRV